MGHGCSCIVSFPLIVSAAVARIQVVQINILLLIMFCGHRVVVALQAARQLVDEPSRAESSRVGGGKKSLGCSAWRLADCQVPSARQRVDEYLEY